MVTRPNMVSGGGPSPTHHGSLERSHACSNTPWKEVMTKYFTTTITGAVLTTLLFACPALARDHSALNGLDPRSCQERFRGPVRGSNRHRDDQRAGGNRHRH